MKWLLVFGCLLVAVGLCIVDVHGVPIIPMNFPLFKQCDPRWANNTMGGNNTGYDTICIQGCAMSSVSMALNGKGFRLTPRVQFDPQTLNLWLREHKGYVCIGHNCNNLRLDAPDAIAPGKIKFLSESPKPALDVIKRSLHAHNPVTVAHVRNSTHFVLVTGWDSQDANMLYVNDPFFSSTFYYYDDISDVLSYHMDLAA
eukprot:TRINITY_DN2725_c0_g1_i1.p1 TRINITY_DN2725_c0_g1~~TRINITY_DN2725_c0_g1_i1.p1  ORF type:complete len:200 (-),score=28.18 TRINITY_DN2725_c0_g1_i1:84-683(-)